MSQEGEKKSTYNVNRITVTLTFYTRAELEDSCDPHRDDDRNVKFGMENTAYLLLDCKEMKLLTPEEQKAVFDPAKRGG